MEAKARAQGQVGSPPPPGKKVQQVEPKQNQGAEGPLLGDMGGPTGLVDHPSDDTPAKALPSKAGIGRLEESRRAARDKGGQKRA